MLISLLLHRRELTFDAVDTKNAVLLENIDVAGFGG
jgi:hypothetical protein